MVDCKIQLQSTQIRQFHSNIYEKYYNTTPEYDNIFILMQELEDYLAQNNFDPSMFEQSGVDKLSICTQLRDCFEIGAKVALRLNKRVNFDTWINLLLLIYFNYDLLTDSTEKELMFCLYLLELICEDNYDDFHCMVEKIPLELQENGPLIQYPLKIQKCLSSYDFRPIYEMLDRITMDVYCSYFVQPLIDIVRREQVEIIKNTYINVTVEDIKSLLRFSTYDETVKFIQSQDEWIVCDNGFVVVEEITSSTTTVVTYSMTGDLRNRLCTHLNRPYYHCNQCDSTDSGHNLTSHVIMTVPNEYPADVVNSVEDYGNFINLFDSLL